MTDAAFPLALIGGSFSGESIDRIAMNGFRKIAGYLATISKEGVSSGKDGHVGRPLSRPVELFQKEKANGKEIAQD